MEQQCWANVQYSRRECLEIVGIPHEISGEVLGKRVFNIFDKIGCSIFLIILNPATASAKKVIL